MERLKENAIWTDVFDGDKKGRNMLESHSHPHFELSFVVCGNITVLFDEKKYSARGNCVILSPPKTNHHIMVEPGRYFRHNIYFWDSLLESLPGYDHKLKQVFEEGGSVVFLTEKGTERLCRIFELIADEESDEGRSLLLALIIGVVFNEAGSDQRYGRQKESYIDDVLRVILKEYGEKLIADELAARFFVSRTKLMTDFKAKTGKTLVEQITFVRVEQAKAALNGGEGIFDTAISCGFVNASNFSRVFKRYTGMTPKEYQNLHTVTKNCKN